ncbi:hypothetical protein [Sphingomonas oryzagri]|uniref:DUF4861 domain-containing protein n=1 Tax=Sphingomonas oryzagri TaxID=3042314 RepID=A0ABT6N1V2_9SPHN|nr:hypothetical protein [Sphingomonas oryzagri]MDH7639254.1 hypothetical protein [Sphingomonas oryzagri]
MKHWSGYRAIAAALLIAAAPAPQSDAVTPLAPILAAAPKVTIRKGNLGVTIALPDPARGFYRSTRFDWSGMITDVTRGSADFYGLWADGVDPGVRDFVDGPDGVIVGPRNAATGPAEEFANRDGETVPGYDTTPAGGTFIKIGVGRLRKPDDRPYDHFAAYDIVDGGRWRIWRGSDRIVFTQRLAPDAVGYGYEYRKTIRLLPGGVMIIAHRLRNIGTRPIKTQVYTHNFARFDGAEIGPGVRVHFPYPAAGPVSDPRLAALDGADLRYLRPLAAGDRVQLPPLPGDPHSSADRFRVEGANGASITMQADVPLVRTAFWSIRRAVAVEPFVAIDVAPGAEQSWSWRYVYAAPPAR